MVAEIMSRTRHAVRLCNLYLHLRPTILKVSCGVQSQIVNVCLLHYTLSKSGVENVSLSRIANQNRFQSIKSHLLLEWQKILLSSRRGEGPTYDVLILTPTLFDVLTIGFAFIWS